MFRKIFPVNFRHVHGPICPLEHDQSGGFQLGRNAQVAREVIQRAERENGENAVRVHEHGGNGAHGPVSAGGHDRARPAPDLLARHSHDILPADGGEHARLRTVPAQQLAEAVRQLLRVSRTGGGIENDRKGRLGLACGELHVG